MGQFSLREGPDWIGLQSSQTFEATLAEKLKDRIKSMKDGKDAAVLDHEEKIAWVDEEKTPVHVPYQHWDMAELGFDMPPDDKEQLPELADAEDLDLNKYISAKVMLPKDGHTFATGRVIRRARNPDGELIGKENQNPALGLIGL